MRLIDADALMEDIEQTVRFSCRDGVPSAEMRGANKVIDRIEVAPTVSPDEVRGVGEWVDKGVRAWSCSCCGTPLNHIRQFASFEKNELPNYCPNCGARMEVSEDA